jgi:hypothetical protein
MVKDASYRFSLPLGDIKAALPWDTALSGAVCDISADAAKRGEPELRNSLVLVLGHLVGNG